MRILLDECVPRRIARDLVGHAVRTVSEMGWNGTKNGALLELAAARFDAFVTTDARLPSNSAIPARLRVVVMRAISNRYADLAPLVPDLLRALETVQPGGHAVVER